MFLKVSNCGPNYLTSAGFHGTISMREKKMRKAPAEPKIKQVERHFL